MQSSLPAGFEEAESEGIVSDWKQCDQCARVVDGDQAEGWSCLWIIGDTRRVVLNHQANTFCSPLCAAGFAKHIAENETKNRS